MYGGRSGGERGCNDRFPGREGGNQYGGQGGGPPNHARRNSGSLMPRPTNAVPYGFLPGYLPGAASMVEQLDRKLLVILRDGRHFVGILRTFDQFSNMVMQETCERRVLFVTREKGDGNDDSENTSKGVHAVPGTICYQTDIQLGLFIVRGDNVVLLGEIEDDQEEKQNEGQIRFVTLEEFELLEEEEARRREESMDGHHEPINWDFDMDLVV